MVTMVDCTLCGLQTDFPIYGKAEEPYCCHSCKEIAILLENEPLPDVLNTPQGGGEEVTLSLGGLWCASCAWLVEERLKRVPGVQMAQVSFVQRKAQISFDAEQTTVKKLSRRIRQFGYQASLNENELDEEDRFFTRMLIGGLLAMHIMVISLIIYARGWLGLASVEAEWLEQFFYLMQSVLSIPLFLILGFPILRAGITSMLRGLPNVQSLVTLGVLAATAISIRNLFFVEGPTHVYFDTAAMLLFLVTIGRWLEIRAHKVGKAAIQDLLEPIPDAVTLITNDGDVTVPVGALQPGQRIAVHPGQYFPVDGMIAQGVGEIDESLLTGEPRPIRRSINDSVFAGTQNLDGNFEVIIARTGGHTRAGKIQDLFYQALWKRSPFEKLVDRVAAWMVWGAIVVADLTFVGWYQVGFETALLNTLSVLLIACPCALGLATPLTLWQAVGKAAEQGVLFRSTAVIERLNEVEEIFLDKTGTLTIVPLQLHEVYAVALDESELLARVVAVEQSCDHPFAEAICSGYEKALPEEWEIGVTKILPGWGVKGSLNDSEIWIGNLGLMEREGFQIDSATLAIAVDWQAAGQVVSYVAWDGTVQGLVSISEKIRPETKDVLNQLRERGYATTVLTGDTESAGARWAEVLGIPVQAGLKPEDKLEILAFAKGVTLMVGDGINDSPALAQADIGVTLQTSAEIAQTAAEITLLSNDLNGLPWALALAGEAQKRLRQNLIWAAGYNIIGVGLAVAGLLQPVLAALAMILSSILVTRNSLQIKKFPGWKIIPVVEHQLDPRFTHPQGAVKEVH